MSPAKIQVLRIAGRHCLMVTLLMFVRTLADAAGQSAHPGQIQPRLTRILKEGAPQFLNSIKETLRRIARKEGLDPEECAMIGVREAFDTVPPGLMDGKRGAMAAFMIMAMKALANAAGVAMELPDFRKQAVSWDTEEPAMLTIEDALHEWEEVEDQSPSMN